MSELVTILSLLAIIPSVFTVYKYQVLIISSPNRHTASAAAFCTTGLVSSPMNQSRAQEALQLCSLFLPPAHRRKLTLLLRFMHKMAANRRLTVEESVTTRDLVG